MSSTREQAKKEMRALRRQVDLELRALLSKRGRSNSAHFVHTVQVVTTDRPVRSGGASHTLSYQVDVYQSLVQDFVQLDSEKKFKRTLLGEDYASGPFWYADLGDGSIIDPGASRKDDYQSLDALFYDSGARKGPQGELLREWQGHLQRGFNHSGATMLVTQAYEDRPVPGELHVAAVFFLFNRPLQKDLELSDAEVTGVLYPLARLARDFVVKRIFRLGRESMQSKIAIIEGAVQKLLREPDRDHALSKSVLNTLGQFGRVITSQYPMLISGEQGTGKFGVAREIHRRREAILAETASQERAGPLLVVNAPSLGKNRQTVLERIKQKAYGGLQDPDRLRWESRRGSLVFEDIDRAHMTAQDTIRELLDHMMGEAYRERKDLFPLRKPLFISGPDLHQLARANQFSSSLFAQVSAFEIHCPPLRERQQEHDAIIAIVEQRVCEALRIEEFQLTEAERDEVYNGAWECNFWDLYRYVVRCAISRGSN